VFQHEVKAKINKGLCPPQEVTGNPVIEYATHIVLPYFGELVVERGDQNGGNT
jgi:hypothetical protein